MPQNLQVLYIYLLSSQCMYEIICTCNYGLEMMTLIKYLFYLQFKKKTILPRKLKFEQKLRNSSVWQLYLLVVYPDYILILFCTYSVKYLIQCLVSAFQSKMHVHKSIYIAVHCFYSSLQVLARSGSRQSNQGQKGNFNTQVNGRFDS